MKIKNWKLKISPKKSLGQNFLVNQGILDKIVQAAEITKEDIVLEVGPGTGNLTKKLAEKAGGVIAVEKDRRLIEGLREKFKNSNVEIIEGDVLKLDIDKLFKNCKLKIENSHYKVVGNIPYYITSHFLRTVFESANWRMARPKLIVLTIQKEVAQRIMAKPPHVNLLALSVKFFAEPKIVSYVSKGSFRPIPKVDSAIIKLVPNPKTDRELIKKALEFAKKSFTGKRKQIKNTLPDINWAKVGISPETRPEELGISDWLKIASGVY